MCILYICFVYFYKLFFFRNFLASFTSICHPLQWFRFFHFFFVHSFIRSFVRLRVKINNFFCCCCFCYFIRIYCVHFCNILWLLSYLSVLSAIYISNWYTFEIRHIIRVVVWFFDFNTHTHAHHSHCVLYIRLSV